MRQFPGGEGFQPDVESVAAAFPASTKEPPITAVWQPAGAR